jgi:hypothetical protein
MPRDPPFRPFTSFVAMKAILKEPLLHFLLLGAALFIGYSLVNRSGGSREPGEIVVSLGRVEHLAAGFATTRQRPPTDAELKGLIDDWVREEIATREAMALGLDKDDSVIRRRLRQKLEFVSDDLAAEIEPTDADLDAYLQAHPNSFRIEPRFTFTQVYFDPTKHGDNLARDTARVLAHLQSAASAADTSALGDSLLLERTFQATPRSEVGKQFGESFAAALDALAPGQWHGPIESGYGVHLVLVSERTAERLPALAEARDAVRREWTNVRRQEGNGRFYQELLKRYTVTIEGLGPADGRRPAAATK